MKEKKHTKKTTSDKKKGKDSIPIINEPVAKVEVVKTREEEAEELYKQVSEINTQLIEEGNKVLMETLPEKIKQLSEYIKNKSIFYDSCEDINCKLSLSIDEYKEKFKAIKREVEKYRKDIKKSFNKWRKSEMAICENLRKGPAQTQKAVNALNVMFKEECIFPVNPIIQELHEYIVNELKESIHILSPLSILIELKMPRLEDGNNFGVDVQKEILHIITESSGQLDNIIDNITKYYRLRGSIVIHCVSKPYLQDIFQSLIEFDTAQFYSLKLFIKSIRDIYDTIYDAMIKNYDKIYNPRSVDAANTSFFYRFCYIT